LATRHRNQTDRHRPLASRQSTRFGAATLGLALNRFADKRRDERLRRLPTLEDDPKPENHLPWRERQQDGGWGTTERPKLARNELSSPAPVET